ncbi:MAG TPA: ABC transporter permease [Candidatus Saccharimonadia bacterium]|nr:ABC transporter permease [Candidatus Saccharimonadia bacterium]
MRAIFSLAAKDWRLLLRQPAALFFVVGWPIVTAVLFGLIFGGGGGASAKPRIAIVDEDTTAASQRFAAGLNALDTIETDPQLQDAARELVRTGKRTAAIVIPPGYGAASTRLFHGAPPVVHVLVDPSRKAERAMIGGYLQQVAGQGLGDQLFDPALGRETTELARAQAQGLPEAEREPLVRLFDSLDAFRDSAIAPRPAAGRSWTPLTVEVEEIAAKRRGPGNGFSVTFPQGLLWGIIGCLMTFASALVLEEQQGTLARLRASPLAARDILAGKSLACAGAIAAVAVILFALAYVAFDVRPGSWPLLALAVVAAAFCFTGIMMLIASAGTSVESVSGAGWAVMLPLMMFGGGMIPLFAMPAWMVKVSHFSPVKWATLALEGAIWRGFTFAEMALPLGLLLAIGAVTFALGARSFARTT